MWIEICLQESLSLGTKNTAASLELCSTSVATRKSTSELGSSLAAPLVARMQEKPYIDARAPANLNNV